MNEWCACGMVAVGRCIKCRALLCARHVLDKVFLEVAASKLGYGKITTLAQAAAIQGYSATLFDKVVCHNCRKLAAEHEVQRIQDKMAAYTDPFERAIALTIFGCVYRGAFDALTERAIVKGWIRMAKRFNILPEAIVDQNKKAWRFETHTVYSIYITIDGEILRDNKHFPKAFMALEDMGSRVTEARNASRRFSLPLSYGNPPPPISDL